jgi:hypothetical protein
MYDCEISLLTFIADYLYAGYSAGVGCNLAPGMRSYMDFDNLSKSLFSLR